MNEFKYPLFVLCCLLLLLTHFSPVLSSLHLTERMKMSYFSQSWSTTSPIPSRCPRRLSLSVKGWVYEKHTRTKHALSRESLPVSQAQPRSLLANSLSRFLSRFPYPPDTLPSWTQTCRGENEEGIKSAWGKDAGRGRRVKGGKEGDIKIICIIKSIVVEHLFGAKQHCSPLAIFPASISPAVSVIALSSSILPLALCSVHCQAIVVPFFSLYIPSISLSHTHTHTLDGSNSLSLCSWL